MLSQSYHLVGAAVVRPRKFSENKSGVASAARIQTPIPSAKCLKGLVTVARFLLSQGCGIREDLMPEGEAAKLTRVLFDHRGSAPSVYFFFAFGILGAQCHMKAKEHDVSRSAQDTSSIFRVCRR